MAKPKRRSPNNYGFATTMLLSVTPLFLGYDLAMVSNTAVLADADLKLLAYIVALSSLLGALTAVGAQCIMGERCTVLLSAVVLCAGALVRGVAADFAVFTVGIFVNGLGMGQVLVIVPAYAAELSPASLCGLLTSYPDGFVYLGCILGSLCYAAGFAKLPLRLAWRLTLVSGTAVPALISSAVLLMPESPRWLVAKDQLTKARCVLAGTCATLDEAKLRMLEIKAELGMQHDGSDRESVTTLARHRWRAECRIWRDLFARPTEAFRRALFSALVSKVFQQASGIASILQYVQKAFHQVGVSSKAQLPSALLAFGCVTVLSFAVPLLLVELAWQLVTRLVGSCLRLPSQYSPCRGGSVCAVGMTRRQEQLKWARGLSATMLFSMMALVWIALGPARWTETSRSAPRWLRATTTAVNRAVCAAIFDSFAWLYVAIAVYGNLLVCAAVVVLGWWFFHICCLRGAKWRRMGELMESLFPSWNEYVYIYLMVL